MKLNKFIILSLLVLFILPGFSQSIKPDEVKKEMKRVADWQIEHFRDTYSGREKAHHPLDWTNGALYVGMVKWAAMAGDDQYYEWLKKIGEENEWKLHHRQYHADDHTVGQLYCELYRKYDDKEMLAPMIKQFDFIRYHPSQSSLEWRTKFHQDRWNWCDALFMSPPVWAKLYQITGKKEYLDFMVKEYKATTDFLFDKKENLYYRDQSFMGKLDHGTKIFWARGNGWVFAGLANIMNELNPKTKEYKYFLGIYKKMAKKLLQIQTPQGHWAMSLLGQEFYPTPETSGSSFYVFGLAWGINQGILDRITYEPAVAKGWNAMCSYITKDGMLGYVQPIGAAPGKAWADKSEVYGSGAFLSAGSEVFKLYSKAQK
ncbi:glycoside hydrolase family 88/105 protein [Labilibaculum antarcticum]|uniref:Glycosyl hydrolase family 88 n=1 Tax=Labilibaculum antarcticum TaxID=1717717 RepID=A0A1Y1CGM9_9BACT|nr:glycoside hydrolase family 88 protein [Labilibaculum antarcticum]BAX78441.1 glycosyl hydrolase family 88 [Labilibaculum antarcticum]